MARNLREHLIAKPRGTVEQSEREPHQHLKGQEGYALIPSEPVAECSLPLGIAMSLMSFSNALLLYRLSTGRLRFWAWLPTA